MILTKCGHTYKKIKHKICKLKIHTFLSEDCVLELGENYDIKPYVL